MKKNQNDSRRECEKVDGTWFKYFYKVVDPEFNDELCIKYEHLLGDMYGDFFERNLATGKGKLISLGVGFGMTEIPLARKGYKIIGIDNDIQVLELLERNAKGYARGNLEAKSGDLYEDWHKEFIGQNIQACVSFGLMEHFARKDLDKLIKKQFQISPLMICMVPINTPETLKAFKAEKKPEGHIDENGIYRNFWTAEFWENEIFKNHRVVDKYHPTNYSRIGQLDMVVLAVRKGQKENQ